MNRRQRETLAAVFERPTRSDITWRDVESLFRALGAELSQGSGSRVRVYLRGVRAVFHRPHPRSELLRPAVVSVRHFLLRAGVDA